MNSPKLVYTLASFFLTTWFLSAQTGENSVAQNLGSAPGYVLYAPLNSRITYLIDKCGTPIHRWTCNNNPGQSAYLLPDGSLLRTGNDTLTRGIPSIGGKIDRYDWDSRLLWSYSLSNKLERQHHDIYPMPNGNVLALVYRKKTKNEAEAAGRKPAEIESYLLDEKIIEIKPVGKDSGIVVWEWDVWDHLIQDLDKKKPHYGTVAQNPQLLNINPVPSTGPDWLHFNSVAYNPSLDQILVSIHELSEIFIIDHSTTTAQAASHKGGKRGKGGDILYRWGNPATYNMGTVADQKLFKQHNAHWIEKGLKDEGKIMVFNNGSNRPRLIYSTVEVIEPPVDKQGSYVLLSRKAAGPAKSFWNYTATDTTCFYSENVSSAQRLANGNTVICVGRYSKFFEIDSTKKIVWAYCRKGLWSPNDHTQRSAQVFRCVFYEPNYSAFTDRDIKPCPVTEIDPDKYPCFAK